MEAAGLGIAVALSLLHKALTATAGKLTGHVTGRNGLNGHDQKAAGERAAIVSGKDAPALVFECGQSLADSWFAQHQIAELLKITTRTVRRYLASSPVNPIDPDDNVLIVAHKLKGQSRNW